MTLRRHLRSAVLSWAALLPALAPLQACSRSETQAAPASGSEYETLELRYQGNIGTVTPAELAEELGYLAPIRLEFMGSTISGPASVQAVVTGDTDFGGAFNGAIIKLVAAKTIPAAMAQAVPSAQICDASYRKVKSPRDNPSIVSYQTEVIVSAKGPPQVLSAGAVLCDPLP